MKNLMPVWTLISLFTFTPGGAMAIEEPAYIVVPSNTRSDYEIREYGKVLVAETRVEADFEDAGNQAFRLLADYIFGKNKNKTQLGTPSGPAITQGPAGVVSPAGAPSGQKIAMTAPVGMEKSGSGYLVQFTMPQSLTLDSAPEPIDSRVKLREIPPRKLAVYRYSGSWSEARFQEKLSEFQALLRRDGLEATGPAHFARFNSPFMIWFLRRNEIWILVR
jgi:hypothetical protein